MNVEILESRETLATPPVVGSDFGLLPMVLVNNSIGFYAFDPSFRGGVVAVEADFNQDGIKDIVVGAGPGAGPQVEIIDGTKLDHQLPNHQIAPDAILDSFYAFNPSFRGGVSLDVSDLNHDGIPDVVVGAGPGGGPQTLVLDGSKLTVLSNGQVVPDAVLGSYYAFNSRFTGGVNVAVVNGDIVTVPNTGGGPQVTTWNSTTFQMKNSFYAFDSGFTTGLTVTHAEVNYDGVEDIFVGSGPKSPIAKAQAYDIKTGALLLDIAIYPDPGPQGVSTATLVRQAYLWGSYKNGDNSIQFTSVEQANTWFAQHEMINYNITSLYYLSLAASEQAKIPSSLIQGLAAIGDQLVILVGNGVTDYPGFLQGTVFIGVDINTVPGASVPGPNSKNVVVINKFFSAVSINPVIHEQGHMVDYLLGNGSLASSQAAWLAAYSQGGFNQTPVEAYAESFAKYYTSSNTRDSLPASVRAYFDQRMPTS